MDKTILITGSGGYVGSKIYKDLKDLHYNVHGTYHEQKFFDELYKCDLTDQLEVQCLIDEIEPDTIVHIAANASTATSEADPTNTRKINVDSVRYITELAKLRSIRVIYLSSFACFNPSNVYGRTKLEAEDLVNKLDNYIIIRASLIVGISPNQTRANFFNSLLNAIQEKKDFTADTSWEFEFTELHHLSEVIQIIIKDESINKQMIPLISSGVTSRYDFSKEIGELAGVKVIPIDQNRIIPLPDFDQNLLRRLNLPQYTYKESLARIKADIEELCK